MTATPERRRGKLYEPYVIMLAIYALFAAAAFVLDTPGEIAAGMARIITSRAVLVTDFIAVGGLGATLVNSAAVGAAGILMLTLSKVKPNGAIIAAMWVATGFAFFGKNLFNMIPLTSGVWLYSRYTKESFTNYSLASLLVATLSPAVSEICFYGMYNRALEMALGVLFGVAVGFIFPAVSAALVRAHGGYDLYSMGFAGGLICLVMFSLLDGAGIKLETAELLSSGNGAVLASGLYIISAILLLCGFFLGNPKENFRSYLSIFRHSGRLVSDFYFEHGNAVYINMGALGILATTLVLSFGAPLNGPVVAGIFTIIGFGSFGKHLRNVLPVLAGAIAASFANRVDPGFRANVVAILFSTGLAPIAGQFGVAWGAAAGFLHVGVAAHTAYLSGGMNLYHNGFAAAFVAMFLLPVITIFKKEKQ